MACGMVCSFSRGLGDHSGAHDSDEFVYVFVVQRDGTLYGARSTEFWVRVEESQEVAPQHVSRVYTTSACQPDRTQTESEAASETDGAMIVREILR